MNQWEVDNPADIYDVDDVINSAGTRSDYLILITGVPDRDSPKTGYSRGWTEGQSVTLSFKKDLGEVQRAAARMDELGEFATPEDYMTELTRGESLTWFSVTQFAVVDKFYYYGEEEP